MPERRTDLPVCLAETQTNIHAISDAADLPAAELSKPNSIDCLHRIRCIEYDDTQHYENMVGSQKGNSNGSGPETLAKCAPKTLNNSTCVRCRCSSTNHLSFTLNRLMSTTSFAKYLIFVMSIAGVCHPAVTRSVRDTGSSVDRYGYQHQTVPLDSTTYLSKFGYLPKSDMETGALRNKSELTKAVKQFQKMAHLPVTGNIDSRTIAKMAESRCGVSDDIEPYFRRKAISATRSKRYVLGPSKWPNRDLTYRILNYTPDLRQSEINDALRRAFKIWSDATQLTFQELHYGEADIMIRFAHMYHQDGYPFDGPGMTLAHAFFPGAGQDGDVHFDEDEHWTSGTEDGVNLFTVAAHEIGHALGLGHSSVLGALMYPWYQGYTPDLELHGDDLVAIQYLYGRGDVQTPRPRPPYDRTTTTRYPTYTPRPRPTIPPVFTTKSPQVPTTPNWGPNRPPDPCTTDIDAAAKIRQEAYLFKGLWFWRVDKQGVMDGYPVEMNRFWYGFPKEVQSIDAVYERVDDGKIVFFSGKRFWMYGGNHMSNDCPREGCPLTDMGFPNDIDHVDAAFVWGYNMRTYLVTGSMYWRYNEATGRMDHDYPRDMSMWDGVPVPVNAALQLWDGNTYFFQGPYYWKFHDALMRTQDGYPQPLGPFWLECSSTMGEGPPSRRPPTSKASSFHNRPVSLVLGMTLILIFHILFKS